MNVADTEVRQIFGPAENKAQRSLGSRKPVSKPIRKAEKEEESTEEVEVEQDENGRRLSPLLLSVKVPKILQRQDSLLHSNLSLSDSCSSDASTDSFHCRASTGRIYRTHSTTPCRRKQFPLKSKSIISDDVSDSSPERLQSKKRCTWVTPNTGYTRALQKYHRMHVRSSKSSVFLEDPTRVQQHFGESMQHSVREVFADFDPISVAKLNEKKILVPGSTACSLLSDLKVRAVFENARQVSKIIDEFGSFDKHIWSFVNYKPIVGRFRYPHQVPVKTSKADVISKDLVQRGFRGVGPTVVYSFMQVAGITNDQLISCFRFQDCVAATEVKQKDLNEDNNTEVAKANEAVEAEMCRSIDELSFSLA